MTWYDLMLPHGDQMREYVKGLVFGIEEGFSDFVPFIEFELLNLYKTIWLMHAVSYMSEKYNIATVDSVRDLWMLDLTKIR
jgi:hypothetical protein